MRSHIYDNPADDPETEPFLKAIASAPGDGLPRHIFADWLEENGYDNAAKGQRWAANNNKYPHPGGVVAGHETSGGWYLDYANPAHKIKPDSPYFPHVLPGMLEHYAEGGHHMLFTRSPKKETGTLLNERDFLHGAHRVNWHPETGEPIDSEQESK